MEQWVKFVGQVEDGYQFTIYDYHNDLDLRGKLEEVLEGIPAEDRATLEAEVHDYDDRFIRATREVPEVIATYDRGFWARRIPTKLVGELAADLGQREPPGK